MSAREPIIQADAFTKVVIRKEEDSQVWLLPFLAILLLICLFRVPVTAALAVPFMSPFASALPLLFVVGWFAGTYIFHSKKDMRSVWAVTLISVLCFACLGYSYLVGDDDIEVYRLAGITVSIVFPAILYYLLSERALVWLLDRTLEWAVLIAFLLTSMEFLLLKSGLYSAHDIHFWLAGNFGPKKIRINTFMGLGAISGLLSLCGYSYFLAKCILYTRYKKIRYYVLVLLALTTVFLDDSFILLIGAALATLSISLLIRKKWSLKSQVGIILGWLLIAVGALKFTPIYDRFGAYFYRGEIITAASGWLSDFSGCKASSLYFGIPHESVTGHCNPGEFHALTFVVENGLLVCLPWIFFFFIPFFLVLRRKWHLDANVPLFVASFSFMFPALHYSGVEMWGNNYLFEMIVALLLKRTIGRSSKKRVGTRGSSG